MDKEGDILVYWCPRLCEQVCESTEPQPATRGRGFPCGFYLQAKEAAPETKVVFSGPTLTKSNINQCRCKVWKYIPLPDYTRVDCGRHRIYLRVEPELYPGVDYGGSQNLPLPPRIYPLYCDYLKCLRLPEYTPLFNNFMRPSQNLPLPPRISPSFQQLYATFPESTPPSQNKPPFQ